MSYNIILYSIISYYTQRVGAPRAPLPVARPTNSWQAGKQRRPLRPPAPSSTPHRRTRIMASDQNKYTRNDIQQINKAWHQIWSLGSHIVAREADFYTRADDETLGVGFFCLLLAIFPNRLVHTHIRTSSASNFNSRWLLQRRTAVRQVQRSSELTAARQSPARGAEPICFCWRGHGGRQEVVSHGAKHGGRHLHPQLPGGRSPRSIRRPSVSTVNRRWLFTWLQ